MIKLDVGMRTVKWWVRYIPGRRPGGGQLTVKVYRTKKQAGEAQRVGEVIFQVTGYCFPLTAKRAKRLSKSEE